MFQEIKDFQEFAKAAKSFQPTPVLPARSSQEHHRSSAGGAGTNTFVKHAGSHFMRRKNKDISCNIDHVITSSPHLTGFTFRAGGRNSQEQPGSAPHNTTPSPTLHSLPAGKGGQSLCQRLCDFLSPPHRPRSSRRQESGARSRSQGEGEVQDVAKGFIAPSLHLTGLVVPGARQSCHELPAYAGPPSKEQPGAAQVLLKRYLEHKEG